MAVHTMRVVLTAVICICVFHSALAVARLPLPKASSTVVEQQTTTSTTAELSTTTLTATEPSTTTTTTVEPSTTKSQTGEPSSTRSKAAALSTTKHTTTKAPTTKSSTAKPSTTKSTTHAQSTNPTSVTLGSSGATRRPEVTLADVLFQTRQAAHFLESAALLAAQLNMADAQAAKDGALAEQVRGIAEISDALLAVTGQKPLPSAAGGSQFAQWALRGGQRAKGACTVISGYWDKECECQFLLPINDKSSGGGGSDDNRKLIVTSDPEDCIDDHTTPRPTLPTTRPPWHQTPYERDILILKQIMYQLEDIMYELWRNPTHSLAKLRREQREQVMKGALAAVGKLRSILANKKLAGNIRQINGIELGSLVRRQAAEVEALVKYPEYLVSQLGRPGGKQPIVLQIEALIEKLEPHNY